MKNPSELLKTLFRIRWLAVVLGLAVVLVLATVSGSYITLSLITTMALASIGALSLATLQGWAGQASLFVAGLLLATGYVTVALPQSAGVVSVIYTLIVGMAIGVVGGLLSSLPSRRLSGIYLLLTTMGFQYMVFYGGDELQMKANRIGGYTLVESSGLTDPKVWLWVCSGAAVLAFAYLRWLRRGRIGRAALVIRSDRGAADVVGIRSARFLATIFAVTGGLIGVAGVLGVYYAQTISYDGFDITVSVSYFVMIAIGGVTSLGGAVFGAIFVTGVTQVVTVVFFSQTGLSGAGADGIQLAYGVVGFLALMIFTSGDARGGWGRLAEALIGRRKIAVGVDLGVAPDLGADGEVRPGLALTNVKVAYGGAVAAVRGVSLDVRRGDVTAIVGPNGAGKTSLLYSIVGFPGGPGRVVGGSTTWASEASFVELANGSREALARKGIAFVPAEGKVFAELTVQEHIRMVRGKDAESKQRIQSLLATFVELNSSLTKRAGLLSGGQRQQLALLCALARRPDLLVVDELTLGLSPVAAERVVAALADVQQRSSMTIVIAEQNVGIAFGIANKVALMDSGLVTRYEPVTAEFEKDVRRLYVGRSEKDVVSG